MTKMRKLACTLLLFTLIGCSNSHKTVMPTADDVHSKETSVTPLSKSQSDKKRTTHRTTAKKSFTYHHSLEGRTQESVVSLQKRCIDQLVDRIRSKHNKQALDEALVTEKVSVEGERVIVNCHITLQQ